MVRVHSALHAMNGKLIVPRASKSARVDDLLHDMCGSGALPHGEVEAIVDVGIPDVYEQTPRVLRI